jgi:hypothetical protein
LYAETLAHLVLMAKTTGLEGSGMAQGEGTGVMPDTLVAWNNNRFDEPHESPI